MVSFARFWQGRQYHLDRMSVRELLGIFYQYPAIVAYHALLVLSLVALATQPWSPWVLFWFALGVLSFPLSWYLLHRYLLQGTLLYKFRLTSSLWKRIHYDHHRDPNDLRVLFGALHTTLPPMFLFLAVVWAATGVLSYGLAYLAASLWMTIWSEFVHCIQHLSIEPGIGHLRKLKKLHRIHHFKNENAYFGITNFVWDRVFGTYYPVPAEVPTSPTRFNLGYQGQVAERYPWVRELSALDPQEGRDETPVDAASMS